MCRVKRILYQAKRFQLHRNLAKLSRTFISRGKGLSLITCTSGDEIWEINSFELSFYYPEGSKWYTAYIIIFLKALSYFGLISVYNTCREDAESMSETQRQKRHWAQNRTQNVPSEHQEVLL